MVFAAEACSGLSRRMLALAATLGQFEDMFRLAEGFGFSLDRTSGSHRIFRHQLGLILNLQPDRNGQAKSYQLKQLLDLVEENGLTLED